MTKKNCEKKIKKRRREATLNISNNSPRILAAEKKENRFSALKCLGLGLTIRNAVLAPKWRRARFFRLLMHCARFISYHRYSVKRPPGNNCVFMCCFVDGQII
jgi:hypothetical protein